jgi:hypothetical protein
MKERKNCASNERRMVDLYSQEINEGYSKPTAFEAEWAVTTIGEDVPSLYPVVCCSACGGTNGMARTAYCPHCGRKMRNPLGESSGG